MKASVLTQKNVCAFLGMIMAFTIIFKANTAEANDQQKKEWASMDQREILDSVQEEVLPGIEVDFSEMVQIPTITIINKYGEVIAAFY